MQVFVVHSSIPAIMDAIAVVKLAKGKVVSKILDYLEIPFIDRLVIDALSCAARKR